MKKLLQNVKPIALAIFLLAASKAHSQTCPINSSDEIIYGLGGSKISTGITAFDTTTNTATTYSGSTVSSSPNALGWSVSAAKFYYFSNNNNFIDGSNDDSIIRFVSYDPVTQTTSTLATIPDVPSSTTNYNASTSFTRGCVTNDGKGYYALSEHSNLYYYDIAANTWTHITDSLKDQNGNNISNYLKSNEPSGDMAIDGNGNLWILSSQFGGSTPPATHSIYKITGPLPTNPVAKLTIARLSQGVLNPGNVSFTGFAFDANGKIFLGSPGGIYILNNDFSITKVGTSTTSGGDLASCALPASTLPQDISGTIFTDANGMSDNVVNHTGSDALPSGLNIVVTDSITKKVIAVTPVQPDGTYFFPGISAGIYTLVLTTTSPTVGKTLTSSDITLPLGWANTGENIGTGTGSDILPNGQLTVTLAGTAVANADFGIEQKPTTNAVNLGPLTASQFPLTDQPGYYGIASSDANAAPLSGNDPEDGMLGTGASFVIASISSTTLLTYNGTTLAAGDTIKNYDPSALKIYGQNGTSNITFTYKALDQALIGSDDAATYTLTASTLPITLAYFNAAKEGQSALLKWATASEINSKQFVIEYSIDGNTFVPVDSVKADGESAQTQTYSYTDKNVVVGPNYFRLKLEDLNGAFKYSDVATVKFGSSDLQNKALSLYPNPIHDGNLNVNLPTKFSNNVQLRIVSTNGNIVLNKTVGAGIQQTSIPVQSLVSGEYFVQILSNNHTVYKAAFIKK